MSQNKIHDHPSIIKKPKKEGGWHVRTKDGRTFSDLSMDEAVDIYHDEREVAEKVIQFKTSIK